mmetsp:Transcript_19164/g.48698  ORF Transcript_19164/g.48698 Transcript_19164/m.48698 type:complete len:231 (-) Transcript_19164:213-905(-)
MSTRTSGPATRARWPLLATPSSCSSTGRTTSSTSGCTRSSCSGQARAGGSTTGCDTARARAPPAPAASLSPSPALGAAPLLEVTTLRSTCTATLHAPRCAAMSRTSALLCRLLASISATAAWLWLPPAACSAAVSTCCASPPPPPSPSPGTGRSPPAPGAPPAAATTRAGPPRSMTSRLSSTHPSRMAPPVTSSCPHDAPSTRARTRSSVSGGMCSGSRPGSDSLMEMLT